MVATLQHSGSPVFSPEAPPVASAGALDTAISRLKSRKEAWVAVSIPERIELLDRILQDTLPLLDRWVAESLRAKQIDPGTPPAAEEWLSGPYPVLRNLQRLKLSLTEIAEHGQPLIPGPIRTRPDGQVVAQIFPKTTLDKLTFPGISTEIWMEPGVSAADLPSTQALAYKDKGPGKVALVLGAGNVSSIGVSDALYKLFVEDQVVLLKSNPVCAYLDPILAEAFRALIEPGYLQIVAGGAAEGRYLCDHPDIEEVHITGSDKTFEAIVFGSGPEGAARKANGQPLLHKRITGELGNVSPLIIVPGPWTERDLDGHADQIMLMLVTNAGFNCLTTRVIVTQKGWPGREKLLQKVRERLQHTPPRAAYYPGAAGRYDSFIAAHPEAEQYGARDDQHLPWALIADLDPNRADDICFQTEAFCSLFAETALEAESVPQFIDKAVQFVNGTLWGTLVANIIVHPASLNQPAIDKAVDRAIATLRYGTIGVNYWGAASYALVDGTWGAFPGHTLTDIQSGIGVVHNTLMFSRAQKTVLRAPFHQWRNPIRLITRGTRAVPISRALVRFEAARSPGNFIGLAAAALRR